MHSEHGRWNGGDHRAINSNIVGISKGKSCLTIDLVQKLIINHGQTLNILLKLRCQKRRSIPTATYPARSRSPRRASLRTCTPECSLIMARDLQGGTTALGTWISLISTELVKISSKMQICHQYKSVTLYRGRRRSDVPQLLPMGFLPSVHPEFEVRKVDLFQKFFTLIFFSSVFQFLPASNTACVSRKWTSAADPRGLEQYHTRPGDETGAIFNTVKAISQKQVWWF